MLTSILVILILGYISNKIASILKIPSLLLYLVIGILIGPYSYNFIHSSIINQSALIRQLALIIILLRTGFNLNTNDLKQIGLPALLMSFIPALFEIGAITFLAPLLFDITYLDSALLGSVLAAVSPAVIIPRMIEMIDEGIGQISKIPQLIMASASLDDIFALVLFESLLSLSLKQNVQSSLFLQIPLKLLLGLIIGYSLGYLLYQISTQLKFHHYIESVIILISAIVLITYEQKFNYSGLFATMALGFSYIKNKNTSNLLKSDYLKLWQLGELFLFVIVGASVSLNGLAIISIRGCLLLLFSLSIRSIGVYL